MTAGAYTKLLLVFVSHVKLIVIAHSYCDVAWRLIAKHYTRMSIIILLKLSFIILRSSTPCLRRRTKRSCKQS